MKWLQAIQQKLPKHKYAIDAKMLGDNAECAWTNLGYWDETTSSYPQACQQLAERLAQAVQLTPDEQLLNDVEQAIEEHLAALPKAEIARTSIANRGALVLVKDRQEAIDLINQVAPEHLELCLDDAELMSESIRHAGAIFMGRYTPEAIGDYCAGPNHVLPTSGTARFSSPLGVYDFQKRSSLIMCSEQGVKSLAKAADILAQQENLDAHARSARYRYQ